MFLFSVTLSNPTQSQPPPRSSCTRTYLRAVVRAKPAALTPITLFCSLRWLLMCVCFHLYPEYAGRGNKILVTNKPTALSTAVGTTGAQVPVAETPMRSQDDVQVVISTWNPTQRGMRESTGMQARTDAMYGCLQSTEVGPNLEDQARRVSYLVLLEELDHAERTPIDTRRHGHAPPRLTATKQHMISYPPVMQSSSRSECTWCRNAEGERQTTWRNTMISLAGGD